MKIIILLEVRRITELLETIFNHLVKGAEQLEGPDFLEEVRQFRHLSKL